MLQLWGEGILTAGSQGIPPSHTHSNLTQEIYWEKHRRVAASAQESSSRELSGEQALCRLLWDRPLQGGLGLLGFCGLILSFLLCRVELGHLHPGGLGPRVSCGQSLVVTGPQGQGLAGHLRTSRTYKNAFEPDTWCSTSSSASWLSQGEQLAVCSHCCDVLLTMGLDSGEPGNVDWTFWNLVQMSNPLL